LANNFSAKLSPQKSVLFFSPILKKVKGSPTTLQHQLKDSLVPPAAVGSAFRRLLRPRGIYGRRLRAANASFTHAALLDAFNSKDVSAAPPKQVPKNLETVETIVGLLPGGRLGALTRFLVQHRWWLLVLVALLLVAALLTGA